jgi:hypothetical protein
MKDHILKQLKRGPLKAELREPKAMAKFLVELKPLLCPQELLVRQLLL